MTQRLRSTKPKNWDAQRVADIGQKMRQLIDELSLIFPERRHLIQQMIYALLTREHVLIYGVYGTGKSDLVHTLFTCITGAKTFSIGLSKFMTEGNVIGIPDPKKMREEGKVEYRRDGGMLDADFAELDELFDSSPPLLRVLLGILNERQFKRGRQVEDALLHTAIASTNGDPDQEKKNHPELGAVVDRFLFQAQVKYLAEPESRRRMLEKYVTGQTPTITLTLDDVKFMSEIVVGANQITDPAFIAVYDEAVEAYVKTSRQPISDRRRCKLIQLVEANALLFGRYEVDYEDIDAVRWGLCLGGNDAQHEAFKASVLPVVEKAKASKQQSIDDVQCKLLDQLATRIPVIPPDCPKEQLVDLARSLVALEQEITDVKTQLPSTEDRKQKLLSQVSDLGDQVQVLITGKPKVAAPKPRRRS